MAAAPKRPIQGHGRKPLPARLPRETVLHEVAPEKRPCPDRGEIRQPFNEAIREQLEYVPASMIMPRHVRPKYACKACAAHVVIAGRLAEPLKRTARDRTFGSCDRQQVCRSPLALLKGG